MAGGGGSEVAGCVGAEKRNKSGAGLAFAVITVGKHG